MARAINIKDCPTGWQSMPQYVYIGRAGHGLDGYFGNPFRLNRESERDAVLAQYRAYFKQRWQADAQFRLRIGRLPVNALLVCFCAPKACHGDVIAQVINWFASPERGATA